ncbi:putative MFS family arabinose efflux permease [Curtobacterium sp. PhB130]|uniref:MFS transporter n=1 Tax=Curtobacterium sp. PhB130 TaxID=2485178 RepID=UPI000F4B323D|nr:MFS transporter [Curtobacterium sp. PhB130]ROS75879.1 putative MFS family arabinose efflux permease [Curtobacterium sp. PhB130]
MSRGQPRSGQGALTILRDNSAFRRLYFAQLLSQGGDWFVIVPLLGVLLTLSGTSLWGALVLAADTIVIAVCSPFAGTVVDRVDRRTLLIMCDLASAIFVTWLFFVHTPATVVIAVAAVGGVAAAKAFFTPTATAAVPTLVPAEALLTATVISGAIWAVMLVVGSSLSALVTAIAGPYWCFGIDIASFLCSASIVASISELSGKANRTPPRRRRLVSELADTVRIARGDRRIAALIAAKPGTALGNGILAVFPVLAVTVFGIGPAGVGVLFAARGVGALAGPLLARRFVGPATLRSVIAAAIALFAIGYALFPIVTWFPAAVALVALAHVGGSAAASISTYGLQLATDSRNRGRIMSSDFMIQTAVIGCSQLAIVGLADLVGNTAATTVAAAAAGVYAIMWWGGARSLDTLRSG